MKKLWASIFLSSVLLAQSAFSAPAAQISPVEFSRELHRYLLTQYRALSASPLSTGILYDLAVPLSKPAPLDGSINPDTVDLARWLQADFELGIANFGNIPIPDHQTLRRAGSDSYREYRFPIAVLNYRYNQLREGQSLEQALQMDGTRITAVQPDAFTERRLFAATILHGQTYRGQAVRFSVDPEHFYFTNDPRKVRRWLVNFDDGLGERSVNAGMDVIVNYNATGRKTLRLRAVMEDGSDLNARMIFDVLELTAPTPTETWTVQAEEPYNGRYAAGLAYVYLAAGHTVVTNPMLVSEGYDWDNTMNWDELYDLLNQEGMIETARAMGYDPVVLNYDSATTHIQANALVVEALIHRVNQIISPTKTSVLVGASMGGLTTRYALVRMEHLGVPHRVRTWISFDGPQRGANIPLGIQYWMDFFASQSSEAAALRDALNSPAARQMLLAHFTNPASGTAAADPMRTSFLSDLNGIGNWPASPHRVAIANGSGMSQSSGFNTGAQIIRYEYRSFLVDITGNVWALNSGASQRIFQGVIDRIWPLSDDSKSVTVAVAPSWDNAPGGQRGSMLQMDTTAVPYGDVVALYPHHCFIPTISALNLPVADPFYNISADTSLLAASGFDAIYYPAQNEDHVFVSPESVWWFLGEAADSLGSPAVVMSVDSAATRLHWSPVAGARSYRVYVSDDVSLWSGAYTSLSDTMWNITDPAVRKFYRVVATTSQP